MVLASAAVATSPGCIGIRPPIRASFDRSLTIPVRDSQHQERRIGTRPVTIAAAATRRTRRDGSAEKDDGDQRAGQHAGFAQRRSSRPRSLSMTGGREQHRGKDERIHGLLYYAAEGPAG